MSMQWIRVEERLPPANEDVLFVARFDDRTGEKRLICFGYKQTDNPESGTWFDKSETDRDGEPIDVYGVTHWMPVPELP